MELYLVVISVIQIQYLIFEVFITKGKYETEKNRKENSRSNNKNY